MDVGSSAPLQQVTMFAVDLVLLRFPTIIVTIGSAFKWNVKTIEKSNWTNAWMRWYEKLLANYWHPISISISVCSNKIYGWIKLALWCLCWCCTWKRLDMTFVSGIVKIPLHLLSAKFMKSLQIELDLTFTWSAIRSSGSFIVFVWCHLAFDTEQFPQFDYKNDTKSHTFLCTSVKTTL